MMMSLLEAMIIAALGAFSAAMLIAILLVRAGEQL